VKNTNTKRSSGNIVTRTAAFLDRTQQKHHGLSFPYAVIKKYGDDEAGHQAALITYYGFLALFPLLLVATSAVDIVSRHNSGLHTRLVADINTYFPIVGNQLQAQVHTGNKTGVALLIGLLFTFYGARGVANAVRGALDHAWAVPKAKRSGFPLNAIKSFGLLLGAGLGLVGTATLAGYATAELGRSVIFRIVPLTINLVLLYMIFMYIFLIGTSRQHPRKDIRLGAVTATVGLLILQTVGGYLITHQLHNLSGLYGQFALVLAILFWIYLQAQVLTYAIEINVVHTYKLWPRSLTGDPITAADKKAYRMYAEKEAYRPRPEEEIEVTFQTKA
jgi:YihY family inner membrane protein